MEFIFNCVPGRFSVASAIGFAIYLLDAFWFLGCWVSCLSLCSLLLALFPGLFCFRSFGWQLVFLPKRVFIFRFDLVTSVKNGGFSLFLFLFFPAVVRLFSVVFCLFVLRSEKIVL